MAISFGLMHWPLLGSLCIRERTKTFNVYSMKFKIIKRNDFI